MTNAATPEQEPKTTSPSTPTTDLPAPVASRGISRAQWRTMCLSLYPGAAPNSVLMVWDYCVARRLDPLKKPCHIVPMEVTISGSGGRRKEWRDVVMPGIYELRTTAMRTGLYMGHSEATLGPVVKVAGIEAPEWCAMTFYRWWTPPGPLPGQRIDFPVRVLFREVVALKDGRANKRWSTAPEQMLKKCTEAAGLREAFPDELGGEQTEEEMAGQRAHDGDVIDTEALPAAATLPKPEGFDEWLIDITAAADEGAALFAEAWKRSPEEVRTYLVTTDDEGWQALKRRSVGASAALNEALPAGELNEGPDA